MPERTHNLITFRADLGQLKLTWLSQFVHPGAVLISRSGGTSLSIWVTHSNPDGAVGIRVRTFRRGETHYFRLIKDPKSLWKQCSITGREGWYQQDVELATPAVAAGLLSGGECAIVFFAVGKPMPYLEFSGRRGFSTVNDETMKRLYMHLKVHHVGAAPTDAYTIGMGLLGLLFPNAEACDHEEFLMHRFAKRSFRYDAGVTKEDAADVLADLDEDEVADIEDNLVKAGLEELKASVQKDLGVKKALGGGSKKPKAKPVLYDLVADGISEEDAAKFMPKRAGAHLEKDTKFHMRWKAFYPGKTPPRYATKVFRTLGERDALMYCLREVWSMHTRDTGEPCPFDLACDLPHVAE